MGKWEDQIQQAAFRGATAERVRCLWILDLIVEELEFELSRKLLMEQERHTIEVKLRLARAIVAKAKRGILSGLRPKGQVQDVPINGDERDPHARDGDGVSPS